MIWSKKLRLFKELLASSLRHRLALRTAGYKDAYEARGRTWIEFDGAEVISFCDFVHENAWREAGRDLAVVRTAGIFSKQCFGEALGQFLEMDIESALASKHPLIVGLAVLDRRVGKRKLRSLSIGQLTEPTQIFLDLRLGAEGLILTDVTSPNQVAAPFAANLPIAALPHAASAQMPDA